MHVYSIVRVAGGYGSMTARSSLARTVALKRPRSRATTALRLPRRMRTSQSRPPGVALGAGGGELLGLNGDAAGAGGRSSRGSTGRRAVDRRTAEAAGDAHDRVLTARPGAAGRAHLAAAFCSGRLFGR